MDIFILNDAPPPFARRIVLDGREFWCRDPEASHAFRRDVHSELRISHPRSRKRAG